MRTYMIHYVDFELQLLAEILRRIVPHPRYVIGVQNCQLSEE